MSYDISVAKNFDDEFEPVGHIENDKLIEILKKHPEVSLDENGLWGYGDEETGFAISFEDEDEKSPDVMIFFPYFRINMEQRYRNAAEFAVWLANQLNAKAYDYQLAQILNQEVIENALREPPKPSRIVRKRGPVEEDPHNEAIYIFILVFVFIVLMCLGRLACKGHV